MRRALVVGAVVAAACARPASPAAPSTPSAGISIAIYDPHEGEGTPYAVVDDRRWVEVDGQTLTLERIDPGAALSSLVIEVLGAQTFPIGACTRDELVPATRAQRDDEPDGSRELVERDDLETPAELVHVSEPSTARWGSTVRCTLGSAQRGRYLVRMLYVSSSLAYRARHDITMAAIDHATLATRFAIATPRWGTRVAVTLFAGTPGGDQPTRELAHAEIPFDGSTSILPLPERDVPVRLLRIFQGAVEDAPDNSSLGDPSWGRQSHSSVWVWIELDGAALVRAPARVHVELPDEPIRDIEVSAEGRVDAGTSVQLPLWVDDSLRGTRDRSTDNEGNANLVDRFFVSIANTGSTPREVLIEEHLRPAKRRTIRRSSAAKAAIVGDVARTRVIVGPDQIERARFAIAYDF